MTNHLEVTSRNIETSSPFEKGQEKEQVNHLSLQANDLLKETSKERPICNTDCNKDIMNTSMEASSLNSRQKQFGNSLLNAVEQGSQEQFNKLVMSGGSDVNAVLPALNKVLEKHGMSATFERTNETTHLRIIDKNNQSVLYQYYNSVYEPGITNTSQSDFKNVQDRMSPLF